MDGFLNINKPAGITSRTVVNKIQHLVKPLKTGHAGTLDPLATGVVVVTVGKATRLTEYIQRLSKKYRGTFELGKTSDTEDREGKIVEIANAPKPTEDELRSTLSRFIGATQQRPPAYSALKVAGKRAYDLARAGETIELKSREIHIYRLELVDYVYPQFVIDVECGSGTYIRSLGRDIAESLNSGAIMTDLNRTSIGTMSVEQSLAFEQLGLDDLAENLLPLSVAVESVLQITLTETQMKDVVHGRPIRCSDQFDAEQERDEIAAFTPDGFLAAILRRHGDVYRTHRNFVAVN